MASLSCGRQCPRCKSQEVRFGWRMSTYCGICGYSRERGTTVETFGIYGIFDRIGVGKIGILENEGEFKSFVQDVQERAPNLSRAFCTWEAEPGVWRKIYLIGEPREGEAISSEEAPAEV